VGENEIYIALPEGNAAVAPAATSVKDTLRFSGA
jgi:hypothetical protein